VYQLLGGGEQTGKDPTNRGKLGTKRHILVDRQVLPLAVTLTGAHVHDSKQLEATVDTVAAAGQEPWATAQTPGETARG
jgi:hypothetical protein